MLRLRPVARPYAWGSPTAIPRYLGVEPTGEPVAELWFGAHPSAPCRVETRSETPVRSTAVRPGPPARAVRGELAGPGRRGTIDLARSAVTVTESESAVADLLAVIEADPVATLGPDVVARFGPRLPYLLKLIAPARPLSLQVHPNLDRARLGFAQEETAGIPVAAAHRNYKDASHKPELIYALTTFEAVSGFRAPRRAAEVLEGLDAPLARRVLATLRAEPTASGVRSAFMQLLAPATRPAPAEVDAVVTACAARLRSDSTSPRADAIVGLLASFFPADPGIVASLLLNPVTLRPGQAMFIPAGGVHAYLSGVGVELMANSDNVLRAGLTDKHMDAVELFDVVDFIAAPPIRIAPEEGRGSTRMYYAPVDDFELSVTDLDDGPPHALPGRGPRIVLCLDGDVRVTSAEDSVALQRGESVFVPAAEGALTVRGHGTVVQADVP